MDPTQPTNQTPEQPQITVPPTPSVAPQTPQPQQPSQTPTPQPVEVKQQKKGFPILGVFFILLALGMAGLFIANNAGLINLGKEKVVESTPQPTATPDITAGWQTYNSEEGFSFKYPTEATIKESTAGRAQKIVKAIYTGSEQVGEGEVTDGYIFTVSFATETTTNQFSDENIKLAAEKQRLSLLETMKGTECSVAAVTKKDFLSHVSYEFIATNCLGNSRVIMIVDTGTVISLSYDGTDDKKATYLKTLNQILSTFKFIELESSESEKALLIKNMKEYYAKTTNYDETQIKVTVSEIVDIYARGEVNFIIENNEGPGAAFFAKKINGVWQHIVATQEADPNTCALLKQNNFPEKFLCLD